MTDDKAMIAALREMIETLDLMLDPSDDDTAEVQKQIEALLTDTAHAAQAHDQQVRQAALEEAIYAVAMIDIDVMNKTAFVIYDRAYNRAMQAIRALKEQEIRK